jgi:hypothetical protein
MGIVRWLSAGAMGGFGSAVWLDRFIDIQNSYQIPIALLMALFVVAMIPDKRSST